MNRKERMAATLSGQKPDRVPVGMWYHYSPSLSAAQAAVAHFDYVRSVDLDLSLIHICATIPSPPQKSFPLNAIFCAKIPE